jgi:hypothetical protein
MSSFSDVSGTNSVPQFSECAGSTKTVLVLPNHQNTLKIGSNLVPETSEYLLILMRLSVREKFIAVNLKKKSVFREISLFPSAVFVLLITCHLKWTQVEGTEEVLEVFVLT